MEESDAPNEVKFKFGDYGFFSDGEYQPDKGSMELITTWSEDGGMDPIYRIEWRWEDNWETGPEAREIWTAIGCQAAQSTEVFKVIRD